MSVNLFKANHSSIALASDSELIRLPRAAERKRGQKFYDNFDAHTLVYDVFFHQNDEQVLLVCPPPVNLENTWREASFYALPSKEKLQADFFILRSTMTIALNDVPIDTKEIEINFNEKAYIAKVQPNLAEKFNSSRLMFTMNKNNPLAWIKEWACYHQVMHNVDSIILFDNGSSDYSLNDIEKTLASVKGIKNILVSSLPHKYGPHDTKVIMYRFWANFLQLSSFSILFRRFGGKSFGILNCDIDELVAPIENSDVFAKAKKSKDGLFILKGRWVEGVIQSDIKREDASHNDFRLVRRDFRSWLNANKWSLDPSRRWLDNLSIHPAVHRIRNAPKEISKHAPKGLFWHFKGINTNWKENRTNKNRFNFLLFEAKDLKQLFEKFNVKRAKQND